MASQTGKNTKNIAAIFLSAALILFFKFIPAPEGLTRSGMQVLGIFAGVLVLWLTVSIDWPSLLCLAALGFVPELKFAGILAGSFGNVTFAFLMFTFMCTHALSGTPFIKRCAVAFITSRTAERGPWMFVMSFFASVLVVGSFISPTVLFVVYLPILEEICELLGLKKGDKIGNMLMLGLVFCSGISSGMTPIAHVFSLMAMGFYETATGLSISYAAFMAFAIPLGLLTAGAMMLFFRFVLRPDMSVLGQIDLSGMKDGFLPAERREKLSVAVFALVVVLWVLPGIVKPVLPELAAYIDAFGTAMPPLLGVIVLSLPLDEGRPLLNFKSAMSDGVPWTSLIMCAATLALGSALTNTEIGIITFINTAVAPFLSSLAPLATVFVFALWAAVQTNVSSNMVTVSVVTAVALPITLATGGAVNAAAVCAIVGVMASYAFATPPAMPCVAIAAASGRTDTASLLKYGSLTALAGVIFACLVGYPIAAALM